MNKPARQPRPKVVKQCFTVHRTGQKHQEGRQSRERQAKLPARHTLNGTFRIIFVAAMCSKKKRLGSQVNSLRP